MKREKSLPDFSPDYCCRSNPILNEIGASITLSPRGSAPKTLEFGEIFCLKIQRFLHKCFG